MRNLSRTMFLALFVVGLCLLSAGCVSQPADEGGPTETPTPEVTTTPTDGATASGAAKGSVTAVSYTALMTYLPDAPAGWTADEPMGATWTHEDGQWTWATREYSKGDASASVMIQDSAYYDVGYWTSWDSLISFETSEGYYRSIQVAGYPAWTFFSKPDSYGTWVGLNERFMVYVAVDGGSEQDLDALVNAVDYGGIAALQ